MANRRRFGSIRRTSAGRYQARYKGPDGRSHNGPHTFATKADADRWLGSIDLEIHSGSWSDTKGKSVPLRQYAAEFLAVRRLAPRTSELYERLNRVFIEPHLGSLTLSRITPATVRKWHHDIGQRTGAPTQRLAYCLLRTILNEAVRDGLIPANPCQIKGAGTSRSKERDYLDPGTVWALIAQAPEEQRAAWILTYSAHLRLGELLALRRSDLDLTAGTLRVERQFVRVGSEVQETPTKTGARRTIQLPRPALEAMTVHTLAQPTGLPSALLFTRPDGQPFHHRHIQGAFRVARSAVGVSAAHFHDLRHAGLTLATQSGATLREVMGRAGHSTTHAAMIYQHVAQSRDLHIADAMSAAMEGARRTS